MITDIIITAFCLLTSNLIHTNPILRYSIQHRDSQK